MMNTQNTHNERTMPLPSKDESSEAILKRFDWYIGMQTKRVVRRYPALAKPDVIDLEIDELMQRVRIKFWRALERRPILYPHNYIKRIIRSEIIDMQRQRKPSVSLPTDDDQWLFWELNSLVIADTHDPADEVEQRLESSSLLERTVPLVLGLPPRQRLAMMCAEASTTGIPGRSAPYDRAANAGEARIGPCSPGALAACGGSAGRPRQGDRKGQFISLKEFWGWREDKRKAPSQPRRHPLSLLSHCYVRCIDRKGRPYKNK